MTKSTTPKYKKERKPLIPVPTEPVITTDYVQIGKVKLNINKENQDFVPSKQTIVNSLEELEVLALGINENLPVLLIGDTGTGKTSYVRFLANLTNNAFRRLNLNGSTTIEEFVGHYIIGKDGKLEWIDGVLPQAMKKGYWLCLDELNAALPEILFVLQPVLDDDKFLVLAEHESEVIRPHPNFRIFATMNPSLEYAGTKDLNKALLSRFPIVIQTTYPDAIREIAIIKTHAPDTSDELATLLVKVAGEIRKGKASNSLSFICSSRELINCAKLAKFMPVKQALELGLLNKAELATDKKTIEDILKLQVGKWDTKKLMSLADIEQQIENAKTEMQQLKKQNEQLQKNYQQNQNAYVGLVDLQQDLVRSKARATNANKPTTAITKLINKVDKLVDNAQKTNTKNFTVDNTYGDKYYRYTDKNNGQQWYVDTSKSEQDNINSLKQANLGADKIEEIMNEYFNSMETDEIIDENQDIDEQENN